VCGKVDGAAVRSLVSETQDRFSYSWYRVPDGDVVALLVLRYGGVA